MPRNKLTRVALGGPTYTNNLADVPVLSLLFSRFDPGATQEMKDLGADLGGFGNLNHPADLTATNIIRVAPRATLKPALGELQQLFPWILNAAGVGVSPITYTFGAASTPRYLDYTDTVGTVQRLLGCVVSKATFACRFKEELTLDLECFGINWGTPNAPAFPNFDNSLRWLHGHLSLTLGGTVCPIRSFTLTVDHKVDPERFFYGFTSTPLNLDRVVTLKLEVPYGIAAFARSAGATDGGTPAVFTWTGSLAGNASTMTWTAPAFRYPLPSVPADVPQEQFITIEGQCFGQAQARLVGGQPAPYPYSELTFALTP